MVKYISVNFGKKKEYQKYVFKKYFFRKISCNFLYAPKNPIYRYKIS